MDEGPLRDVVVDELRKLWGNAGPATQASTLGRNAPTIRDWAERWSRKRNIEAVEAFLEHAVQEFCATKNADTLRAIWRLGRFQKESDKNRKEFIGKALGTSYDRVRQGKPRHEQITLLADAVLQLVDEARLTFDPEEGRTPPQFDPAKYVGIARDSLEIKIQICLDRWESLSLWGEPGNGKSFVARKVALRWAGSEANVLLLRGGVSPYLPGGQFETDLEDCLAKLDARLSGTLVTRQRELKHQLSTTRRRVVVVIDDVPEELLRNVLPEAATVPIIVVSRQPPARSLTSKIRVEEYSPVEAARAFHENLPELNSGAVRQLCEALGYRPEAINLARERLLNDPTDEVLLSLLEAVRQDPAVTLEAVSVLAGRRTASPLVSFYREVLRRHAEIDQNMVFLDTLLWLSDGWMNVDRLDMLTGFQILQSPDQMALLAAMQAAETSGLIKRDGIGLRINGLSRDILRALRQQYCEQALYRFVGIMHAYEQAGVVAQVVRAEPGNEYKAILAWSLCLRRMLAICDELFEGGHSLTIVPLLSGDLSLVVQNGLSWFMSKHAEYLQVGLVQQPGQGSDEFRIWVAGRPPRAMTDREVKIYKNVLKLLFNLVLLEAIGERPTLQFDTTGPDGFHHESPEVFQPETASQLGPALWAYCGKRGSWDGADSSPPCPRCNQVRGSQADLNELLIVVNVFVELIMIGDQDEVPLNGVAVRYLGMAARLALRIGDVRSARTLFNEGSGLLSALEASFVGRSPLRVGLGVLDEEITEAERSAP